MKTKKFEFILLWKTELKQKFLFNTCLEDLTIAKD